MTSVVCNWAACVCVCVTELCVCVCFCVCVSVCHNVVCDKAVCDNIARDKAPRLPRNKLSDPLEITHPRCQLLLYVYFFLTPSWHGKQCNRMRAGTWLPEPNSRIRSAEIHLLCHRYGTKTNCIPKINELGQQIQTRAWATQRLLSLNFAQGYINGFLLFLGKVISGSFFNGFFIGGWRNWFFEAFLGSWFWRPSQQNYRNRFLRSMFAELISKNFPAELIFGKFLWRFEFNSHLEENYFQSFDSGTLLHQSCIKRRRKHTEKDWETTKSNKWYW